MAKPSLDKGLLLSLLIFFSRVVYEEILPSSGPSVCQMEITPHSTTSIRYQQCPTTCKQSPILLLLMSPCWRVVEKVSSRELLRLSHWRQWPVYRVHGQAGLLCHLSGLRKAERGGGSHSEIPSPSTLEDPAPTAAEEAQLGVAVLAICTLHTQLSNLCCFLPKSRVGLTLCTKCTSVSGSSSKCPH